MKYRRFHRQGPFSKGGGGGPENFGQKLKFQGFFSIEVKGLLKFLSNLCVINPYVFCQKMSQVKSFNFRQITNYFLKICLLFQCRKKLTNKVLTHYFLFHFQYLHCIICSISLLSSLVSFYETWNCTKQYTVFFTILNPA